MTNDSVADLVRRAHDGEVLGEALFARMAELEDDPVRRRKLTAAQLLEEQTRVAAARLADDLGVEVGDAPDQRDAGVRVAEGLAAMGWEDRMRAIAGATASYRSLYEELEAALPRPQHPAVAELLRHERALNAFAAAESAQDPDALDTLLGALDNGRRARVAR